MAFLLSSGLLLIAARTVPAADQSYRLIGTIEGKDFTGAVLDDGAGKQLFYRIREPLPDGSQIMKVRSDHIVVKRGDGSLYEMFVTRDAKPSAQHARPAMNTAPGGTRVEVPPGPAVQQTGKQRQLEQGSRRRRSRTRPRAAGPEE